MGIFDSFYNPQFVNDYETLCDIYMIFNGLSTKPEDYQRRIVLEERFIDLFERLNSEDPKRLLKLITKDLKKGKSSLYVEHPVFGELFANDDVVGSIIKSVQDDLDRDEKIKEFIHSPEQLEEVTININNNTILERKNIEDMPEIKISPIGKQFDREGKLASYVIVDVETTGLKAQTDKIIQLSAAKVIEGKIVSSFNTLINPGTHIDKKATEINGITDEMVKWAPALNQVAESFLDYVGSNPVIGYNVSFDLKFLYTSGIDILKKRKIYDAYLLAKQVTDWSIHSLDSIFWYYYGFHYPAHNSLYDCIATGMVFEKAIYYKLNG